jgi:hypothetical protein
MGFVSIFPDPPLEVCGSRDEAAYAGPLLQISTEKKLKPVTFQVAYLLKTVFLPLFWNYNDDIV